MRGVAKDLRGAFDHFGDMVPVGKVANAIKHGKHPQTVINWHHFREILKSTFARLAKLHTAAAEHGARKITGAFGQKRKPVRFHRDPYNPLRKINPARLGPATKKEANYREATFRGFKRGWPESCGKCTMYHEMFDGSMGRGGNCTAVKGTVYVHDVCDFFEPFEVKKAIGNRFVFDPISQDVLDSIRAEQDRLIQQLETDARDTIDAVIRNGLNTGTSVEDIATEIKDTIGLTDTQWTAVNNYQRMLEELDSGALQRQLRNDEYDAIVQDAIDSGVSLSEAAIENAVEDYIDNYLDYRAATIAATESTRAANLGLQDAYLQAVERGAVPEGAITRQWQLGDQPCPICESIPDNNPDGVGVDESFDSDDGPVDNPPVHPNCECSVDYVTDVSQLPDDEGDSDYIGSGSFGVGGVNTPYMDEGDGE